MKRVIMPYMILLLSSLILLSNVYAKEITYNRIKATNYASEHCGTSPNTKYNFAEYKCYDGAKPECRADNPWLTASMRVDCANFVSQALIAGGFIRAGDVVQSIKILERFI